MSPPRSFSATVAAGFASPVDDAQRVFRCLLEVLSRPGQPRPFPILPPAPVPLSAEVAAILLTMADFDSPVWVSPSLHTQGLEDWLAFHTGASLTDTPARASFAVCAPTDPLPPLDTLSLGSAEAPELSTTILFQGVHVASPTGTPLRTPPVPGWTMQGPGIAGTVSLTIDGLPAEFETWWADNTSLYPQGVDVLLCAEQTLCGLSRTTQITPSSASIPEEA